MLPEKRDDMDPVAAQTQQKTFHAVRGLVAERFPGFELAFDRGQLFCQLADGADPPRRVLVAEPERKPEEKLEVERERKILRDRRPCLRSPARDGAVDHLAERVQVVPLGGSPVRRTGLILYISGLLK